MPPAIWTHLLTQAFIFCFPIDTPDTQVLTFTTIPCFPESRGLGAVVLFFDQGSVGEVDRDGGGISTESTQIRATSWILHCNTMPGTQWVPNKCPMEKL